MKTRVALADFLEGNVKEGTLWSALPDGRAACHACAHRCHISPGHQGICRVRFNRDGKLYVPWGYVSGLQVDPMEKKPFYHAYPGARAASFGMLGCNFHCGYCQNWYSSQMLRDPMAYADVSPLTAQQFLDTALARGARVVCSTYNEPLITAEWSVELFRMAREKGLAGSYVSNGHATREALEYLRPWVDLYKVDLKTFQPAQYRKLGGDLESVLSTIRMLVEMDFWVEVVTLVVPGFNDSDGELRQIAEFLASVSPDIPWHVTAFHPDYQMEDTPATPVRTLLRACEQGREAGIHYVYAGNIPGALGEWENTRCHSCGATLIQRQGFMVIANSIKHGKCSKCGADIPGRWD